MSRHALLLAGLVLLGLRSAAALDFEVTGYECDPDLYITADFSVTCDGQKRCTFGASTATLSGVLHYNKVYNTGVNDNVGYLSADMELVTLQYQFFDKAEVPLCDDTLESADGAACPGDGSYEFSVDYALPSAGSEHQSWLASGWRGSGTVQIFAAANDNMLIGECTFTLDTMVTPAKEANFYSRTVNPPSAAATVGIVLGVLAVVGLACLYCYCCKRKAKTTESYYVTTGSRQSDDGSAAYFKQLDDHEAGVSRPSLAIGGFSAGGASSAAGSLPMAMEVPSSPGSSGRKGRGGRFFGAFGRKKAEDPSYG